MNQKLLNINGATICTESFGSPSDPAVLLLMGATASMLYWDERFCRQLADKGFFVIRYDNRDTGRSTTYAEGAAGYNIVDLADDAVGILQAYDIAGAHFFGMSLGGLITQIAALRHPEKVLSLTLFATGPWGPSDPNIPEMDDRIVAFQQRARQIDWSDEDAVVNYLLEGAVLMSGTKGFDRERYRQMFQHEFKRANNYISMYNHATLQGGEEYWGKLNEIDKPCLIIHGDKDLIWHYRNAMFLKNTLKNASLLTLHGTGHELNTKDWELITDSFYKAHSANQYM